MRKSRSNVLSWIAIAGAVVGAALVVRTAVQWNGEAQATKRLSNQVWIDRMPRDERDMIHHLVLIDHRQGKFGALGASSRWRHIIEGAMWRLEGDHLTLLLPQDRRRVAMRARTWECKGEAPAPFELCLELVAGDRKARFYSMKEWEVEVSDQPALTDATAQALPGLAAVLTPTADATMTRVDERGWLEGDLGALLP